MNVIARYDALFLDLDGVVYRGDRVVPGAGPVLKEVRRGIPRLFLSNNSSRTPEEVSAKLTGLGVDALPEEVLTSAFATASLLEREGASGSTAFVIGGRGLTEALQSVGVRLLQGHPERADLVVVGWDGSVDYDKLRTASLLVERGARLIASNADASYPAPDGLWPGAGAILSVVTTTTGAVPIVVGKPARPLYEAAAERTGASHPLVVGDRLDTDIRGATAMGWDALLVLTGTSTPADLLASKDLPTYVAPDLSALLEDVPPARFRLARQEDLEGIRRLLASAGLSADGAEGRLDRTIVSGTDSASSTGQTSSIDATACLQVVEGAGILRSVAVRGDLRGKGLGTLSVATAVRDARRQGIPSVSLFTQSAAAFFEQLGFRRVERSALPEPVRTSRHAAEECAASATSMLLSLR